MNVGGILRTAVALSWDEAALCGVTVTPPSDKLSKTSRGMDEKIRWTAFDSTDEALDYYRAEGCVVAGLEYVAKAKPAVEMAGHDNLALVVGNEAHGIAPYILKQLDVIYRLPMKPGITGINVASAFTAAAYLDANARGWR